MTEHAARAVAALALTHFELPPVEPMTEILKHGLLCLSAFDGEWTWTEAETEILEDGPSEVFQQRPLRLV